ATTSSHHFPYPFIIWTPKLRGLPSVQSDPAASAATARRKRSLWTRLELTRKSTAVRLGRPARSLSECPQDEHRTCESIPARRVADAGHSFEGTGDTLIFQKRNDGFVQR